MDAITHAAALSTLGRLRYYAQDDPHLRGLVEEFDSAVAAALDIPPGDVAARTGTEAAPTEQEREFAELLEASSLGSPRAKALRERTDWGSMGDYVVRRVFGRALADLRADGGWEGSVELLASLPGCVTRQVRAALVDIAGITSEAQRRRAQRAEPAPSPEAESDSELPSEQPGE
jgi:hypothetical protein